MATKTLDELKRENAEEEAKQAETEVEEVESEEVEEEELESDEAEDAEDDDESDEDSDEDKPAWMQSEEQSSNDDPKFRASDIAAAKRKLKAKLEQKDTELEELKAEVERLKSGGAQPQPAQQYQMPRREQFEHLDDPEAAYTAAVTEYTMANAIRRSQQQAAQQAAQQALQAGIDRHYKAAAELVAEHGIAEDVYQQADGAVKRAIDQVMKGQGEIVASQLINLMGEGSEKAMFYVGRNPNKLLQLQQALSEDPSGIKAAIMLGEIKASVSMPKKTARKAPAPGKRIQGDAPAKGSALARKLQKQYEAADKRGDVQAAFDARKAARAQGVDVSGW